MIVSASYRTDIPAFYPAWFLGRIAAGFCRVRSPYGGTPYKVSLRPGEVEGFVLWTRNLKPLWPALDEVRARAPFVVHFTVTGYPRSLEAAVIEAENAAAQFAALRSRWGPRAAVWRYDPILISSLTPISWHRENFARLAARFRGTADEAVVSFADFYRKTGRALAAAAKRHGFSWRDPEAAEKRALLAALADIAAENGFRLTLCTEPDLAGGACEPARCIDAERLSSVAGHAIAARGKGNRPGCLCAESRDIGAYDTCPHGCVYCYAVANRRRSVSRAKTQDPSATMLG